MVVVSGFAMIALRDAEQFQNLATINPKGSVLSVILLLLVCGQIFSCSHLLVERKDKNTIIQMNNIALLRKYAALRGIDLSGCIEKNDVVRVYVLTF